MKTRSLSVIPVGSYNEKCKTWSIIGSLRYRCLTIKFIVTEPSLRQTLARRSGLLRTQYSCGWNVINELNVREDYVSAS